MSDYNDDEYYEVDGKYVVSGSVLNATQEWLQEFSSNLERALFEIGSSRKVVGGSKKKTYIRFDLNRGLGLESRSVEDILNGVLSRYGKIAEIPLPGNAIYLRDMTSKERIDRHIIESEWIESDN